MSRKKMSFYFNKVVVVTGGSEGIGKAMVDMLLLQGAKVATCGRDYDKLYRLQTYSPGKPLLIYPADVSNENDCYNFIKETINFFGRIDVLINNAGISMRALFKETAIETLRKIMDVNFWGAVYCTRFALPYILKQNGTVAGISSIAGYRGLPGRTGYSASKFAMNGWLEALRTELYNSGVNIMWVSPGFVASNIRYAALNEENKSLGKSVMNEKKLMTARECADYILNAIEKRKRSLILTARGKGTVLLNKFLPNLADKLVHRFYFKNGSLIK